MWTRNVNRVLARTIGYQLTRPPGHRSWRMTAPRGERLLVAPVFIFSAARSGSTLLRAILGSHSQLYAPPELPLRHMAVKAETHWIRTSMEALQWTTEDLEHMLWDRVLADALARSGKPTVVVKTPANVIIWRRIAQCWPDARYIFLLRHPGAAVASLHASWNKGGHENDGATLEETAVKALRYMTHLEEARHALTGRTVRYEDLTADPSGVVHGICEYLQVPFEPGMLDYGKAADHRFAPGLGDASVKIRSGSIQAASPPPDPAGIPAELLDICRTWGYLAGSPAAAGGAGPVPEVAAVQSTNSSGEGHAQTR